MYTNSKIIVISLSYNECLGKQVADILQTRYRMIEINLLHNGEWRQEILKLPEEISEIIVVHSLYTNKIDTFSSNLTLELHNELFSLFIMLYHLSATNNAIRITLAVPYLPYSRQDKESSHVAALAMLAKILESVGVRHIITIDIHSHLVKTHFAIPISSEIPMILYENAINIINTQQNPLIIAPDAGRKDIVQILGKKYTIPIFLYKKKREEVFKIQLYSEINSQIIHGASCLVIDDIVDTGDTLIKVTEDLISRGASSVAACITHAILSKNAIKNLVESKIKEIFISDTIMRYKNNLHKKFTTIELIAQCLTKAIINASYDNN